MKNSLAVTFIAAAAAVGGFGVHVTKLAKERREITINIAEADTLAKTILSEERDTPNKREVFYDKVQYTSDEKKPKDKSIDITFHYSFDKPDQTETIFCTKEIKPGSKFACTNLNTSKKATP